MSDDRLDLRPLDPSQDQLRWERLVRSVAARGAAGAARRRPGEVPRQLAAWLRPAMACAAAAALVAWAPAWLRRAPPDAAPPQAAAPAREPGPADVAARLTAWAADEAAGGAALLIALGASDDAR